MNGFKQGMKKPRSFNERGSPEHREPDYLLPLLDAFSGLILTFDTELSLTTCDAKLQFPFFHFNEGSGQAVQYHLEENSALRLQPLHCSTISWQIPPLYEHPFAVIKGHSLPSLTVVQTIETTSFHLILKKSRGHLFPAFKDRLQKNWRNIIS